MIIPSILNIPKEKVDKRFLKRNFKKIHIDVTDKKFVNIEGGFSAKFAREFGMKCEVHLMTANPERQIKAYSFADMIYVHVETGKLERCVELGKKYGVKIGIAINPETKIDHCEIKDVLLMGIHPGKSGRKFIPEVLKKMKNLKENNVTLDGGVTTKNVKKILKSGVKNVVTASALFKSLEENTEIFKKLEKSC